MLIILTPILIFSQENRLKTFHSYGGGLMYLTESRHGLPNISYSIRRTAIQIAAKSDLSLSAGIDLGLFINPETVGIGWRIPVSFDINSWQNANSTSANLFGVYFGAGFGLSRFFYEYDQIYSYETNGIYLHTGIRFETANSGEYGFEINGIFSRINTLAGFKFFKTFALSY